MSIVNICVATSLLLSAQEFPLMLLQFLPFLIGQILVLQFLLHVGQFLVSPLLLGPGDRGPVSCLLSEDPGSGTSGPPEVGRGHGDGVLHIKPK